MTQAVHVMNGIRSLNTQGRLLSSLIAVLIGAGGCSGEDHSVREEYAQRRAESRPAQAAAASAGSAARSSPDALANRDVKIRHLMGRAFAVEDFGAVPLGPARKVIDELREAALAGDAAASYGIFLKLNECVDIDRRTSRGLGARAEPGTVVGCRELSAEEEISAGEWLTLAAEQGNIGARLLYSMDSESVLGGPAALLRDPDRVAHYKQQAVGYLEEMAAQGSTDALLQLGHAYHAGVLVNEDLIASRAYLEAARLAYPPAVPRQQVANLDRTLSAEQLSTALRKGADIHEKCCR